MPVYVLEESAYAGPIPEDEILAAEVTAVDLRQKPFNDKETGAEIWRLEFAFIVTEPGSAWEDQRLWGDTSTLFNSNPNCKLRAWAAELMEAEELGPQFRLDTDELIGLPCRVVVGQKPYIDKLTQLEKRRNFVKDVIRAKAGVAPRQVVKEEDEPF